MQPAPYVSLDDLRTYYDDGLSLADPVGAVDGVSLDIRKGETLGLVGESGCGKTTLGRTLLQLESATDGEVRVDGRDVTTLSGDDLDELGGETPSVGAYDGRAVGGGGHPTAPGYEGER